MVGEEEGFPSVCSRHEPFGREPIGFSHRSETSRPIGPRRNHSINNSKQLFAKSTATRIADGVNCSRKFKGTSVL
jgi:hypothetical protein